MSTDQGSAKRRLRRTVAMQPDEIYDRSGPFSHSFIFRCHRSTFSPHKMLSILSVTETSDRGFERTGYLVGAVSVPVEEEYMQGDRSRADDGRADVDTRNPILRQEIRKYKCRTRFKKTWRLGTEAKKEWAVSKLPKPSSSIYPARNPTLPTSSSHTDTRSTAVRSKHTTSPDTITKAIILRLRT